MKVYLSVDTEGPGAERFGDRGVRFATDDPLLAFRGFLAGNRLASAVDR